MPCFARGSGIMVICFKITDCGKSEQNPASYYYLLVVKLVVKGGRVTTKDFQFPFEAYVLLAQLFDAFHQQKPQILLNNYNEPSFQHPNNPIEY